MNSGVDYHLHGIRFQWDLEKAVINPGKHEVSFEEACEVFFDPFVQLLETQEHEIEVRDKVIGESRRERLLVVVHVWINENGVRIISARRATKQERKAYEN